MTVGFKALGSVWETNSIIKLAGTEIAAYRLAKANWDQAYRSIAAISLRREQAISLRREQALAELP